MLNLSLQPNKQLALLIQELLDLPTLREATKILRAVLDVIKTTLLRGESVHIRGFGTFKIITRTRRPTPNNIIANAPQPVMAVGLKHYQPRLVLIFEPSLPLCAMINMDTPNYKERRSQLRWRQHS